MTQFSEGFPPHPNQRNGFGDGGRTWGRLMLDDAAHDSRASCVGGGGSVQKCLSANEIVTAVCKNASVINACLKLGVRVDPFGYEP